MEAKNIWCIVQNSSEITDIFVNEQECIEYCIELNKQLNIEFKKKFPKFPEITQYYWYSLSEGILAIKEYTAELYQQEDESY